MCELFGLSSGEKVACNDLLREFFTHGTEHPHGWGLASFYGDGVCLEKEPLCSLESAYLRARLTDEIAEDILLAHIRKASVGGLSYRNSHPFALRDSRGRLWTLIHNGTIFRSPELEPYRHRQKGETDSERILCYLVDCLDAGQGEGRAPLSQQERFAIVEEAVRTVTPENKVNLLIYDGELLYVHMNHRGSLYLWEEPGTLVVSTQPLSRGRWREAPLNTLLAYRRGKPAYTGRPHANEYVKQEETQAVPQDTGRP